MQGNTRETGCPGGSQRQHRLLRGEAQETVCDAQPPGWRAQTGLDDTWEAGQRLASREETGSLLKVFFLILFEFS